jgi:transcriptional regulator with XRE-family HTH domain
MTLQPASELTLLFAKRLKEAREIQGLSQRRLGLLVGLDMSVAGTRINRYEQSVHQPDIGTAYQIASVLDIPAAYFYTDDDFLAQSLLLLNRVKTESQREALLIQLRQFVNEHNISDDNKA